MDLRVRMVLLGLVLGVLFAVLVATHGCGSGGRHKRSFHGTVPTATGGGAARARA